MEGLRYFGSCNLQLRSIGDKLETSLTKQSFIFKETCCFIDSGRKVFTVLLELNYNLKHPNKSDVHILDMFIQVWEIF